MPAPTVSLPVSGTAPNQYATASDLESVIDAALQTLWDDLQTQAAGSALTVASRAALMASTMPLAAGTILSSRAESEAWIVASAGASDQHATTAGGVKLYERGPDFSTRARAVQSVARGEWPAGRVLHVNGARYVVDASFPGGIRALDMDFAGRCEDLIAAMRDGGTVRIVSYGDSTTDGNTTTGWSANPTDGSGNPTGAAIHNPPNAWPAIAQSALRQMFRNANISVLNAGYGGKWIVTGWALANFAAATTAKTGWSSFDAVILNFGINDARHASYTPELFRAELVRLCARIEAQGAFPIFATPDATSSNDDANGAILSGLIEVYQAVARDLGIRLIDSHQGQLDLWAARGGGAQRWVTAQPDRIHGGDSLHSFKGAFIAASIYPNTLWLRDEPVVDIPPWSKFCDSGRISFGMGSVTNKFGASANVVGGSYTAGEALLALWVVNFGSQRDLFWASVDGDGYYSPRTQANAPVIARYDYLSKSSVSRASGSSGMIAPAGGYRAAEAPCRIGSLPVGISRIIYNAPTDTNAESIYLGYFSIRRQQFPFAQAHSFTHAGAGLLGKTLSEDDGPVIGFGRGVTLHAMYEFDLSDKAGFFLWAGRTFGGVSTPEAQVRRGVMLFRNSNTLAALYNALIYADGTAAIVGAAIATATVTADFWARGKIRVRGGYWSSGLQEISIYDGWQSDAAIMVSTIPATGAPLMFGGVPCGGFSNVGGAGSTRVTANLVAVEYA